MKIIRKTIHQREATKAEEHLVAANIHSKFLGKIMCDSLNSFAGEYSEDYYEIVDDEYLLPTVWNGETK